MALAQGNDLFGTLLQEARSSSARSAGGAQ
jgi:hypothetical protein